MRKKKTHYPRRLAFRISEETYRKIEDLALSRNTDWSRLVREALESPWCGVASCPHCGYRFENEARKP